MIYDTGSRKEPHYVSINTLIQSKKKGWSFLPTYAQLMKEQEKRGETLETDVEPKNISESKSDGNTVESSKTGGPSGQETLTAEMGNEAENLPESSAPETAQSMEVSNGSALPKEASFELDETDVAKGEEREVKPEKEPKPIQKKTLATEGGEGKGDSGSDPRAEHFQASGGGGEPLPLGIQAKMEPALGMDLQNVRIHRDEQAAAMNGELGARAFTSEQNIYFNQGEYNPETAAGTHLIAHELAHVKQQQTVPGLQYQLQVPAERDKYEQEADATAEQVVNSPRQPARNNGANLGTKQNTGDSIQLVEAKPDAKKEDKPNWILEQVSNLARNLPGYDLLKVVIGRDPISGQEEKRDGSVWIKAIMGIVPGGAALFNSLEQAKVIAKATTWFKAEIQKLNINFATIKGMFQRIWDALSPMDLVNLSGAFEKIKTIFLAPVTRIKNFIAKAGPKLMEIIFDGAMALAGSAGKKIMGILSQGKGVLQKIASDPVGFLKNLIAAVRGGLSNFVAHIGAHLQTGLAGWLFGTLGRAGIILPGKLNLAGIFSLMGQILGVTWQAIRAQVVKRVGPMAEKVMDQVEKSIAWVGNLITKGPIALMEMAKEFLGELLGGLETLFFDAFVGWLRNTVIVRAIQKLISMFNPVGAIIQAIMTIYNMIQFFIERAKQIAAFVNAVFSSIAEITGGNIKKAVAAVEDSLAKALPVAISFMANLVGIGGITAKIKEIIQKIRGPIDKAVGKVVGFIVGKAKGLIGKFKIDDKLIEERYDRAKKFYTTDAHFPESAANNHIAGIDFTKEVEVVEINTGQEVVQWEHPVKGKGDYYSEKVVKPTKLGINSMVRDEISNKKLARDLKHYVAVKNSKALKSTAKGVIDDWSDNIEHLQTKGGAIQLFVPDKSVFQEIGKE